jgi:hypothetical protein
VNGLVSIYGFWGSLIRTSGILIKSMSKFYFRSKQPQRAHICFHTVRLCLTVFKVNLIILNTHEQRDLQTIFVQKVILPRQSDRVDVGYIVERQRSNSFTTQRESVYRRPFEVEPDARGSFDIAPATGIKVSGSTRALNAARGILLSSTG